MFRGEHVTIRPIESHDQHFIQRLNSDPGVRGRVVGWEWPSSLDSQERWFAESSSDSTTHRWLVCDQAGQPLGLTGLWDVDLHNRNALSALKLGGPASPRGQGHGTDAIMAVMAFAFYDVGLHRLHSTILTDNSASVRAYVDKCGWTIEGTARQHVWRYGRFVDALTVGVLKDDFDALPHAEEYATRVTQGSL